MLKTNKSITIIFIISSILFYILWNTGLHGDAYVIINQTAEIKSFNDFLNHININIYGPINFFIFYWVYPVFGLEYLFIYDLLKVIYHLFSIFFVFKFASYYLPNDRALLASVLFIFFPTHDSTIFWYMIMPYTVAASLIMYCHYLMRSNKLFLAYPLLLVSTFSTYVTPPFIIGLSFIFFLEKSYKKFLLFISPAIIYIIYYLTLKSLFSSTEIKIDDNLSFIKFIKTLFLQILSGFDVFLGPSFILKIFSSIYSLSLFSFLLTLPIIFFSKFYFSSKKPIIYKPLLIGLTLVFLLSCCMFAITGMYTQMAFNLGNRVTIYGSLIIAFLLSSVPFSKKFLVFIAIIFILPLFGLSDHWKKWNVNQKIIINNIQTNNDLINTQRKRHNCN